MQPLRHIFDEIVAHESNTPTQPSNRQIYARLAYTPERKSQAHRLPAKGQVARLPRIQNLMNQPTPRSVSRQAGALTTSRLAGRILKTCVVGHSVEAECTACSSCLHRRQWLTHAQARHCCTRSSSRSNVTSPSTADEPQRGIAARRGPPPALQRNRFGSSRRALSRFSDALDCALCRGRVCALYERSFLSRHRRS